MRGPRIMIDPGHGGKDSGAVGPGRLRECDVALAVSTILARLISGWAQPKLTRTADKFVTLSGRAKLANDWNADCLISIHCNSGPPGKGDGYEVFTSPGQTRADFLATELFRSYATWFPEKRKRMDLSDSDPDKEARFTVLMRTRMPAVLFELEFIHTEEGERFLADPDNHQLMAAALADGLQQFFQPCAKR